ncbi:MAG: hypothetical protein HC850_00375 [Rhodomicrobium sp.]|nr:hypothetical protein [Rhodomicrobium sp.]
MNSDGNAIPNIDEAGSTPPIEIFNNIVSSAGVRQASFATDGVLPNEIDGFTHSNPDSSLPETTGGGDEIILANNIRLRSNEEPLAGIYGTTTIDIAPGVGLEFYEGVGSIPGIIQDIGNG